MDTEERRVWDNLGLPGEGEWDVMQFPIREQLDIFEYSLQMH